MTRVRWTIDYSCHYVAQFEAARGEDREALIAYGSIEAVHIGEHGVHIYEVNYKDQDGWEARGQVEETAAVIGSHATWERLP